MLLMAIALGSFAPINLYAAPAPQYNSQDANEKVVLAYYLDNGKMQSIRIKINHRYLKSYWNGREWVLSSCKIEKNKLADGLKEDDSEDTKFLARLPKYVTIDNVKVYFDPDEN